MISNKAAKNAASLRATPEAGFIVGSESAGGNIAAVLASDEKLSPPLTGQFLSAATFFGHQNMPGKYKEQYLSYDQCQKSQILTVFETPHVRIRPEESRRLR